MKLARASAAALALAALLSLAPARPARAGDPAPQGQGPLTVQVHGHASVPADRLEIEFTVSAAADEPKEAEGQYEERLAKALSAAKAAPSESSRKSKPKDDEKPAKKGSDDDDDDDKPAPKKKGKHDKDEEKPAEAAKEKDGKEGKDAKDESAPIALEVTERGLVVGSRGGKGDENPLQKMMALQMGGAQAKAEPAVHFSSKVVVTIRGVSKIERRALLKRVSQLLEKVCENGAEGVDSANPPLVRFLAGNAEDVRQAAYEDAVGKAKARAKSLATLVDRKVARVASVREQTLPVLDSKDQSSAANVMVQMYGIKPEASSAPSTFEVTADVDLEVAFELAP